MADLKNDMKLEAVVIPVSDADRAKEFYVKLGWRLDADFPSITVSGSCSSRRRARVAQCNSAGRLRRRHRVRRRACT